MTAVPPPPEDSPSLEILARIRSGDESGWDELYRRYHDELLFYVRLRLGPGLRASLESHDVFQSVALDALHALPGMEYRGEGSLARFLKKMVEHKIRDRADSARARKRSSVQFVDEVPDQATPQEPRYFDSDRFERLERAIGTLPADMREVVVLRRVEGLASKEVAERTGRSDDAVRKLYSRALARLVSDLGPESAS